MAQVRIEKKSNFTHLENKLLQNPNLSLKARGLLAYMLSLPEDWNYSIEGLSAKCREGKTSIRSAINELIAEGYVVRHLVHTDKGTINGYEYIVYEVPQPSCGFPTTDNPSSENRTEQNNKEQNNQDIPPIVPQGDDGLFNRFWAAYPKKKGKEAAKRAWRRLKPDLSLCRVMAAALERQKRSTDWQKEGGAYIPYPSTWLNGRRWEDEEAEPGPPDAAPPMRPEGGRYL